MYIQKNNILSIMKKKQGELKNMINDRRRGKRTKLVTARITEEDYETLKKNNTSVSKAIEGYIDTNLNAYSSLQHRLKQAEDELAEIEAGEKRKKAVIQQIEDLKKEIGYVKIDDVELTETAQKNVERLARYYLDNNFKYNSFDEYLQEDEKIINERALESGLSVDDYCKLLFSTYERLNQENMVVEREKQNYEISRYANVSADISEAALIELSKAVKVAKRQIKAHKKYSCLDDYLNVNQDLVDNRVACCDLNSEEFIRLMKEAYDNLERSENV